ncbi:hypothetical protein EU519_00975 [Candidatus Thorarchaeota archaeon]|nr:MAG: hypothetical protein EU519_00975 [Candidatus Thorarchaeota archaeon]
MMGTISKIIGLVITGAGAVILFWGMNSDPSLSFVWFLIGMVVMSIGFGLISGGKEPETPEPPPPTVTEIICDSPECDFKELRDFEEGDYILKHMDVSCPKCEGSMTIQGIYIVREKEEEIQI